MHTISITTFYNILLFVSCSVRICSIWCWLERIHTMIIINSYNILGFFFFNFRCWSVWIHTTSIYNFHNFLLFFSCSIWICSVRFWYVYIFYRVKYKFLWPKLGLLIASICKKVFYSYWKYCCRARSTLAAQCTQVARSCRVGRKTSCAQAHTLFLLYFENLVKLL